MSALILPGDEYAKNAAQTLEIIDQTVIVHNKQAKFVSSGFLVGTRPLRLNNRHSTQYFPLAEHPVIGIVDRRCYNGYLVDLGAFSTAFLTYNSTRGTVLEHGWLVLCVVKCARIGHYVEVRLDQVLSNGFLRCIPPHRALDVLLDDELLDLSKYFKFKAYIGLNGRIFLLGCSEYDAEGIVECLRHPEEAKKIVTKRRIFAAYSVM